MNTAGGVHGQPAVQDGEVEDRHADAVSPDHARRAERVLSVDARRGSIAKLLDPHLHFAVPDASELDRTPPGRDVHAPSRLEQPAGARLEAERSMFFGLAIRANDRDEA